VPNRIRFKVPDLCPFCGAVGQATAETTVVSNTLTVQWCCRVCNRGWPVTPTDTATTADQRHTPRERRVVDRRRTHRAKPK
jgi:hypothetical protein